MRTGSLLNNITKFSGGEWLVKKTSQFIEKRKKTNWTFMSFTFQIPIFKYCSYIFSIFNAKKLIFANNLIIIYEEPKWLNGLQLECLLLKNFLWPGYLILNEDRCLICIIHVSQWLSIQGRSECYKALLITWSIFSSP